MKPSLILDIELLPGYLLVQFLNLQSGRITPFEMFDGQPFNRAAIVQVLKQYRLVGFNLRYFDLPILGMALSGASIPKMITARDAIIGGRTKFWELGLEHPACEWIDLLEVAPGVMASLKIYGGRMHSRRLQDLPFEPNHVVTPEERPVVRHYCANDLYTTRDLYEALAPELQLRAGLGEKYKLDLMSKSDAQMAEAIIKAGVQARGRKIERRPVNARAGDTFHYQVPEWVSFDSAPLRASLATVRATPFEIDDDGYVSMPKALYFMRVEVGAGTYRMGMGGLHSSESRQSFNTDEHHVIVDRDVASYYPSIILRCGLGPETMGQHFRSIYQGLVDQRLAAKKAGDKATADGLKIAVNGTFGKLGSPYSPLYAPELLIQVTVTGQLALLMLIEALEGEGIQVISANTDGVTIRCPRRLVPMMDLIVWDWEHRTGFTTEAVEYRSIHSRDVNAYVAIKADGGVKVKGFSEGTNLMRNPQGQIATIAAIAFLRDGTPVERTILDCKDLRQFLYLRTVTGGAIDARGTYMGKVVRWYVGAGKHGVIRYKKNHNSVPNTEAAVPVMDLPDTFPPDIDYDYYVSSAHALLESLGAITGETA